ncbi:MAG: rRNA pseudouridine synthase [Clostridiales bacterium]|jgi:23S rRNA pseudouridine2605 synthase|nr:rRNA pseudouridine synthase [Clostridiales bacterium]
MRINRYLALCGVGSRRQAENLIRQGKVKVNGKVVSDLATFVDEENDVVTCQGKRLEPPGEFTYIMLHKPKGCVCTARDEKGRKTVFDFLEGIDKRLFSVGRLDYDTEGLLLFTDDGELANKLAHPSSGIGKTYTVKIMGHIGESQLEALRRGVELDDGFVTSTAKAVILELGQDYTKLELTIYEGRNRQIKRMFSALGKEVTFLKRTKIGELKLGGLKRGTYRHLRPKEVEYLKNAVR